MKKQNMGYLLIALGIILVGIGSWMIAASPKVAEERATPVVAQSSPKEATECAVPMKVQSMPAKESDETVASSGLDERERKGREFEEYVVKHFSRKYWTLNEWRGDKESDGRYAESNTYPDLELTLKTSHIEARIAVECKWRREFDDNGYIHWCKEAQLQRYNAFAEKTGLPVFIVIGVGGVPSMPETVYAVPLKAMKYVDAKKTYLEKFQHETSENFFYDNEDMKLK